jgi:hypothetical protein
MTSQLNVDTIVDKAGLGGTNVKMANTSTYVSDGGGVTQNTVQGLAKVWCRWAGSATISDSFNVASITDNAVGNFTVNFSNAFANANYSYVASVQNNTGVAAGVIILQTQATGSFRTGTEETNDFGVYDAGINCTQGTGDLA